MPHTTLQHEKVFCKNCGKEPIAISKKFLLNFVFLFVNIITKINENIANKRVCPICE